MLCVHEKCESSGTDALNIPPVSCQAYSTTASNLPQLLHRTTLPNISEMLCNMSASYILRVPELTELQTGRLANLSAYIGSASLSGQVHQGAE